MCLQPPHELSKLQKADAEKNKALAKTGEALWILTFHKLLLKAKYFTNIASACYVVVYLVCTLIISFCAYERKWPK
jgi:hypothetical protein